MIFLIPNDAKPHYFTFLYYRFLFIQNSKIKHNIQKNVDFYADLCYNYFVLLCADLAQSRLILLVDLEYETEPSLLRAIIVRLIIKVMTVTMFSGCNSANGNEEKDTISVYLWGMAAYNKYAPYIQFIVENNDIGYVEGVEGGFKPFNRGSLPVFSGISVQVEEKDGAYTVLDVRKDGKSIGDDDTFNTVCFNFGSYMTPFLANESLGFAREELMVKLVWTKYFKDGGTLAEPDDYITVKVS